MTTLAEFNNRADQLGGNSQYCAIVLSVHGINTTGPWQKSISPILQKHSFLSVPVDYGFHLLKVARPKKLLTKARDALWSAYEKYYDEQLPFSAIGHSFGTLTIGCLIRDNRDARFDQLILAGSVLPQDFAWDLLFESGQLRRVLNEVSKDDSVVRICKGLRICAPSLTVGHSGLHGFDSKHESVKQRFHKAGHSGVLNDVACKQTWIPFLRGEEITL